MAESLKKKTIKGTFWSAADAFLGQGVTFLVGIVLANILSPDEYGLMGICTIFNVVLTGIVDSGFSTALIRKQNAKDEDYNTMFITNMAISILLYGLLFVSAPWISRFFERQELTDLIRVMGLILILQALSITQVTILTKRIDFKTKTKASLLSALCSGIVGIVMACCGFGVWSLAGQLLSRQFIYTICLWLFNKWCPSMMFSSTSFHYMWGFGWKMVLSGLLNNIWNQLYQVVVGKYYSTETLGQYTRSKEFANLFSSNFTLIIQRVTYPVLSELQNDRNRLVEAYRKTIKLSMFVTTIAMFTLGAVAEPLLFTLIGEKWAQAASFLPLICISLSLYPLHALNLNMLQVQGRSDIFLYLEIVKKIMSIGPLLLGIFVDIYWMLIGSIMLGIISFFLNSYYTGRKLGYSSWRQLRDVVPSYGVAFLIAVSIYFCKFLPIPNPLILLVQIVVGVSVLLIICEGTKMGEYCELKVIAKSIILKIGTWNMEKTIKSV